MATTRTIPAISGLSAHRIQQRSKCEQPYRILHVVDRAFLKVRCPNHEWGWPRIADTEKPVGFDAHQVCFKCTTERFFNSRLWKPGPMYRSKFPKKSETSHVAHRAR